MMAQKISILCSAYAFGLNTNDDLHSEHGYFTARGPTQIALTTVMNNGK